MPASEKREFDAEKAQEDYERCEKAFMGLNRADEEAQPVSGYMQEVIAGMYYRLPREVRAFIRDNCRFVEISSGEKQTFVVRTSCHSKRLILLADYADDCMIACEIACAWLGHPRQPGCETMEEATCREIAAWQTVQEWGWDVQAKIDCNRRRLRDHAMRREPACTCQAAIGLPHTG